MLVKTCLRSDFKEDHLSAKEVVNIMVEALSSCVGKVQAKANMCTARINPSTLERLASSVVTEIPYMEPMAQFVRSTVSVT
jgi:hypothetical protein